MKRIVVVGLGPTGGVLCARFAEAGHEVIGVDIWDEHCEAIRQRGLTVEGLDAFQAPPQQVLSSIDELSEEPFDFAVLALKTPFMAEVAEKLAKRKGDFRVISYQNGIGNEEFLARYFGKDRAMRVAINYAGNVVGPGRIRMSFFHKPNHIGCMCGTSICGHAIELAELMTSVGLDTEPTAEIKRLTWRKTILNAALSPVCAVLAQTMADVMEYPPARELVEALLWESISVARAAGFDYGEGFFDDCVKYLATAGPHKPSMLVDIENGQPTEIDFINGKIASVGQELEIPVPLNTTMTSLVKARERVATQGG